MNEAKSIKLCEKAKRYLDDYLNRCHQNGIDTKGLDLSVIDSVDVLRCVAVAGKYTWKLDLFLGKLISGELDRTALHIMAILAGCDL